MIITAGEILHPATRKLSRLVRMSIGQGLANITFATAGQRDKTGRMRG